MTVPLALSAAASSSAQLRRRDHKKDQRLALAERICFTGAKNDGIGHSKVRHQPLGPRCDRVAMRSLKSKAASKVIEGNGALRPLDTAGVKRQPDARDDSVRSPGVQNIMNRFTLVSTTRARLPS